MKLVSHPLKAIKIGAIALALVISAIPEFSRAQFPSLEQIAQEYVDQNYDENPLAILAGSGCEDALAGTSFQATVGNCNQLRDFAYSYWEEIYSPGDMGR